MNRLRPDHVPLPWLTIPQLLVGLSVLSLALVIVGTCSLYTYNGPLPPPRDPPPLPEKLSVTSYRYKEGFFQSLVEEDGQKLGLKKGEVLPSLKSVNPFFAEFSGNQRMKIGGSLETTHLHLLVQRQNLWVGEEGQGYRTDHLVLKITNKTDKHLAYVIQTQVEGRCSGKGILRQNALALKPHEDNLRTECLFSGTQGLFVTHVEVMEISPLGYFYVSRLDPVRLRYDRRLSEGHGLEQGLAACKLLPWQTIELAFQRGEGQWADVIDFYARHNCDEYTFFVGYHRQLKAIEHLPIRPPDIKE